MATEAVKRRTLNLADDTEVEVRPLVIARLRRFYDAWEKIAETMKEDAKITEYDVLVNCVGISLEHEIKAEQVDGALFKDKRKTEVSDKYREWLENRIDRETTEEILLVAGNLDLGKLREMNLRMQEKALEDSLGMSST